MKLNFYQLTLLLSVLFQSAHAEVEAPYPSVENSLAKAAQSRAAFIRVTGEIQRFAPTWTKSDQVLSYLNAVDQFVELEKRLGADTLGAGPTKPLAASLTSAAVKWMDFSSVDALTLRNFIRYADDDVRMNGFESQDRFLAKVDDPAPLRKFYDNCRSALAIAEELGANAAALNHLDMIQGAVAKRLLDSIPPLEKAELQEIIFQTTGQNAIAEVTSHLKQRLARTDEFEVTSDILQYSLGLGDNVMRSRVAIPGYVRNEVDSLTIESLKRVLGRNGILSKNDAERLPRYLQPDSVLSLSQMLIELYEERQIPTKQVASLQPLLATVSQFLDKYGYEEPSKTFLKLSQRLDVAALGREGDYEGLYSVLIDEKLSGTLTIVDTGESNFIMCLRLPTKVENFSQDFNFYFVGYDLSRDRWQAHHYDIGSSKFKSSFIPQWLFDFSFGKSGDTLTLDGTFFDGKEFRTFAARKTGSFGRYTDVPEEGDTPPRHLMGSYWTELSDKSPFGISVTQVNRHTQLYMHYPTGVQPEIFNHTFYNPRTGSLYATTAEADATIQGHWLHIRGKFRKNGNEFCGEYVVGGRGKLLNFCTTLKTKGTPR